MDWCCVLVLVQSSVTETQVFIPMITSAIGPFWSACIFFTMFYFSSGIFFSWSLSNVQFVADSSASDTWYFGSPWTSGRRGGDWLGTWSWETFGWFSWCPLVQSTLCSYPRIWGTHCYPQPWCLFLWVLGELGPMGSFNSSSKCEDAYGWSVWGCICSHLMALVSGRCCRHNCHMGRGWAR